MGKHIIPEQVQYFCDACGAKLTKEHHSDFTLTIDEALRDFSGAKMNNHCDHYELCDKCASSFKSWIKRIQK